MRHAESSAIRRLSEAMPKPTFWGGLVKPASNPLLTTAMLASARVTAEAMPTTTAVADDEGRLTQLVLAAKEPDDQARLRATSVHSATVTRRRSAPAGMMLTTPQSAPVQNPALSSDRRHVVADRGMISEMTLEALEERGLEYILGARMRKQNEVAECSATIRFPGRYFLLTPDRRRPSWHGPGASMR